MKKPSRQSNSQSGRNFDKMFDDAAPARAEMIERGRRLLQDPDYPDTAITREMAGTLLTILY